MKALAQIFPASQPAMRISGLGLLGLLMMTAGAKISVPMWPVPMSMQSFALLLIGAGFARLAGGVAGVQAAMLGYLGLGLFGLPVFAGAGAGPAYFAGPTGGFLLGFWLAATAMAYLVSRGWGRSALGLLAVLAIGNALLFLCGLSWLIATGMAGGAGLGAAASAAVAGGLLPFLPGLLVKTALAFAVLLGLDRRQR